MSTAQYLVTNPKELALLNKFFARRYPDSDTPVKVYVYPAFKQGVELKAIRYVDKDGNAVSYNLPAGQYEIFQTKIREERWDWMIRPNKMKEFMNLVVGPKEEHRWQANPHIINNFLMNVNLYAYTLPEDVWTAADPTESVFGDLFVEDIINVDRKFSKLANIGTDMIKQIHANMKLIDADIETVKDHDLYFCFNIDKDNFKVQSSLTRIEPHLPEGGSITLNADPIDPSKFSYLSPLGRSAIETIIEATDRFNVATGEFLKIIDTADLLRTHGEDLLIKLYGQLVGAGHMLYKFQYNAAKEMVEGVANDILDRLSKLDGQPGLDINSWKVWDYTDPTAPVKVDGVDFEEDIYNRYTESFVVALYGYLITLSTPLLRPYSKITKVSEEDIQKHAIGSIRLAK